MILTYLQQNSLWMHICVIKSLLDIFIVSLRVCSAESRGGSYLENVCRIPIHIRTFGDFAEVMLALVWLIVRLEQDIYRIQNSEKLYGGTLCQYEWT